MDGRPLSDVTVIELGHIVAGPFCSMILADFGANVVKVENPQGGDSVRNSSPVGDSSFNYVNRDKRSITINLKSTEGLAVFYDLVENADVVVENLSPGAPERLEVGYEDLRELNPGLVYCSIKGFNEGPYENYPALDPVAEALSGLMSVTGRTGVPPVRVGTSISDMTASLYGAVAVMGALRQREYTGEGQKITAPLFESTVALMGYWLSYTQAYDDIPGPMGGGHDNWSPYDVFQTADDSWVFVGPSSDRQFRSLCSALDLDIAEDERFETLQARRENEDALLAIVEPEFRNYEAATLVELLRDADVPVAPVNHVDDVVRDEHLRESDALTEITTASGAPARIWVPRLPVKSSAFEPISSVDPPALGEHTDSILKSMGYSDDQIAELRNADAV